MDMPMAQKLDTGADGSADAGGGQPPAAIALEEARRLFDEGREPLAAIARRLGVSPVRFRRLRLEQAWPERPGGRRAPPQRGGRGARKTASCKKASGKKASGKKASGEPVGNSGAAPVDGEPAPADTRVLARRVEAAVRRELANVERRLRCDDAEAAERNARVLASLVKSLVELGRLDLGRLGPGRAGVAASAGGSGAYEDADNPAPPRELAELRDELAAHLARIRGEREAGGGDAGPEPA